MPYRTFEEKLPEPNRYIYMMEDLDSKHAEVAYVEDDGDSLTLFGGTETSISDLIDKGYVYFWVHIPVHNNSYFSK